MTTTIAKDGTTRNEHGHWVHGTTSPNPSGRPPRATEERVRERIAAHMTDEVLDALIRQALHDALDRENPHRREDREFVARYSWPRPAEHLELSRAGDALADLSDDQIDQILADHSQQALGDGATASPDVVEPVE